MRFLIFSIRTLLLRFNHRPGRIFFAVETIRKLETEENKQWKEKLFWIVIRVMMMLLL